MISFCRKARRIRFELALPIPAYIKSFDGYDQGAQLLSKFGVRSSEELTLQISRSEFQAYNSPFLEEYYRSINSGSDLDPDEGQTAERIKEGDLIYFPFDDAIFEIKTVVFDAPFFQFGQGYIFELQCEKFEFSGESFDTGFEVIDDTEENSDYYTLEIDVAEGGTSTFKNNEKVTIYNVSGIETPTLTPPDPVVEFQFYNNSGYISRYQTVTATVSSWDIVNRKLKLIDLSNQDPTRQNEQTADVDVDRLAEVLIIGSDSSAAWLSTTAAKEDKSFDQDQVIQQELTASRSKIPLTWTSLRVYVINSSIYCM